MANLNEKMEQKLKKEEIDERKSLKNWIKKKTYIRKIKEKTTKSSRRI